MLYLRIGIQKKNIGCQKSLEGKCKRNIYTFFYWAACEIFVKISVHLWPWLQIIFKLTASQPISRPDTVFIILIFRFLNLEFAKKIFSIQKEEEKDDDDDDDDDDED